jgi:SAM-dependent methyltransferase
VLDVGSLDLNGSYRELVEGRGWKYAGLDVRDGPNVDVVSEPRYYPFRDGAFDAVISGSTMEHVAAIWLWVPELVRLLRAGGLLVVVAPHTWHEHRHPMDYWRILPQGMKYLFGATESLEHCQFEKGITDTVGSGFKRI